MIYTIIGILMILAVFAALFYMMFRDDGIKMALVVFGATIAIVIWVGFASYLIGIGLT